MRLHAYEDRNNPQLGPLCRRAIVLLDGKRINDCIMADEECGVIERYSSPQQYAQGQCHIEVVSGKVEILDPQLPEVIEMAYTRCDRG